MALPPSALQALRDLGASTDADINAHIIADASHAALEQHPLLRILRASPELALRDALLVAFVVNNGLVMCSRGLDEAVHVESARPALEAAEPAGPAGELDLRTFEQELDALSDN